MSKPFHDAPQLGAAAPNSYESPDGHTDAYQPAVGDQVRLGNGTVQWRIIAINGETLTLESEVIHPRAAPPKPRRRRVSAAAVTPISPGPKQPLSTASRPSDDGIYGG